MPDIKHTFQYKVSPDKVYEALTKGDLIKKWWTVDCQAKPEVGSTARFDFNGVNAYAEVRVEKLEPGKLVEWKCTDSTMGGGPEWVGTTIRYELEPDGQGGTQCQFIQKGYAAETECFRNCTDGWNMFAGKSLKAYLETGKGDPFTPPKQ